MKTPSCLIDRGELTPVARAAENLRAPKRPSVMTVTATRPEGHSFRRLVLLAARHRHTRQRIEEIRSQAAISSSWSFASRASGLGGRRRRWKKYSPVTRAAASSLTASHA
jgi:hypothetical protein